MTRLLAVLLVVGLALPARGEPPPALPGRSVEVEQCPAADGRVPDGGCVVPFKGNLCDAECKADGLRIRRTLEAKAELAGIDLQAAQAAREQAERERDTAKASKASWGVVVGVGGGALVLGLVAGLIMGLRAK